MPLNTKPDFTLSVFLGPLGDFVAMDLTLETSQD